MLWEKFGEQWGKIKPGTYEIYLVTPMVFGRASCAGKVVGRGGGCAAAPSY